MDKMNEPKKPSPPSKWDYEQRKEEFPLYKITFVPEEVEEECLIDNYFHDGLEELNIQELVYDNLVIDLKKLLSMVPKGIDPSDVKIYLRRPRMMGYIQIEIVNEIFNYKDKNGYDSALEEYEKELLVYQEDKKKHDAFAKSEKIKFHKKEIERLEQ